jgi:hypothetical protein
MSCLAVKLVGSSSPMSGNVFATNEHNNVYGPVCAKRFWTKKTVYLFHIQSKNTISIISAESEL